MYIVFRTLLLLIPILLIAISIGNHKQLADIHDSEHLTDNGNVWKKQIDKMLIALNITVGILFIMAWTKFDCVVIKAILSIVAFGIAVWIVVKENKMINEMGIEIIATLSAFLFLTLLTILESFFLSSAAHSLF